MFQLDRKHILETQARRVWYFTKRAAGVRGRADKNFFAADAALRVTGGEIPKGTSITTGGRGDGIGMQALSCISAIAYARAFELEYLHSPFGSIDHAKAGDEHRWEDFFGFNRLFGSPAGREVIDYGAFLTSSRSLPANVVLRFQQCWWFTRRYPDAYAAVAPELRSAMTLKTPADDTVRVALHVRRGDVSKSRNNLRFTDEASILRSLLSVKEAAKASGRDLALTLFSQGSPDDFRAFSDEGCDLKLDMDALETMRAMIEADVLIMAKSSFSYVSALLNAGTVVYEPTFNPPLSAWLRKDADGRVSQPALEAAFRRAPRR